LVYVFAETPEGAKLMVPEVEKGPPVRPGPVLTEVTVPAFRFVTVATPPTVDTEMPEPAATLITPAFVIVTLPVLALTLMPVPAKIPVTPPPPPPEEVMMAVTGSTLSPEPTVIG
jgi:hypothetical protein